MTEIPKWCWVYGFKVVTDARPDVKHWPIMFKAPMVLAILEGRKTQTRRPAGVPTWATTCGISAFTPSGQVSARGRHPEHGPAEKFLRFPFGLPGDRLWVRETWKTGNKIDHLSGSEIQEAADEAGFDRGPRCPLYYPADGSARQWSDNDLHNYGAWGRLRSARFMPRWASRLTLEIVSVRVERVEAISEEDALAEGVQPCGGFMASAGCWTNYGKDGPSFDTARESFLSLWRSIYGDSR